ncbi:MAG: hypothetical protein WD470_10390 [Rhodospirillaceae bacterium]
MKNGGIDEAQIERDFNTVGEIRRIAWQRDPADVMALIERLRVQMMVEDMPRRRRRLYRSLIDYFEEVLDDRFEKDGNTDRPAARRSVREYVRDILRGMDD